MQLYMPPGELLMMVLNVISNDGLYQQSYPVNFSAGAIIENWETVNFQKFSWVNGGNKLWAMSFLEPYEGVCSAKSGNIDDGQVSWLQVTMDVIGYDDISFYRKVSSEANSDFLRFYIDNNLAGQWSGEMGWGQETFQVNPGYHTFKWAFEKDNLNSQGADGGWIDYIKFPSCNLYGTLKVLANAIPNEFCGSGSSQLGAYVLGGSGSLNYQWEPAQYLNDPGIRFPVATMDTGVLFDVVVTDGGNSDNSSIFVNAYPLPATPLIIQEGDSLISSAAEGNQWYDSTGPVQGAAGQVFYPPSEGLYYVIVTGESGCLSDTSNNIHFIFTGEHEIAAHYDIVIFPNPYNETINIRYNHVQDYHITVKLIDISGREVRNIHSVRIDNQHDMIISTHELINCLYLLTISDDHGNILVSKKLMKF
jgi:hypothetical protein